MKLNYKNTALHFLDDPANIDFFLPENFQPLSLSEQSDFKESIQGAFGDASQAFKERVQYVTDPFYTAFLKAKPKLKDVIFDSVVEQSGTLIFKKGPFMQTLFYMVMTAPGKEKEDWEYKIAITVFTKHKEADQQHLDVCIVQTNETYKTFIWKGFVDQGANDLFWITELLLLLNFLKYADIETKTVNAKRKLKHGTDKYVNETNHNIEILDCTWFTTIVNSEGFWTDGHFKMQPFGTGLINKKLIWISNYWKDGMVRKAKISTD